MDPATPQLLTIVLNGTLIALALSLPLLISLYLLAILRRALNADHRTFEQEMTQRLDRIQQDLATVQEHLQLAGPGGSEHLGA